MDTQRRFGDKKLSGRPYLCIQGSLSEKAGFNFLFLFFQLSTVSILNAPNYKETSQICFEYYLHYSQFYKIRVYMICLSDPC